MWKYSGEKFLSKLALLKTKLFLEAEKANDVSGLVIVVVVTATTYWYFVVAGPLHWSIALYVTSGSSGVVH